MPGPGVPGPGGRHESPLIFDPKIAIYFIYAATTPPPPSQIVFTSAVSEIRTLICYEVLIPAISMAFETY